MEPFQMCRFPVAEALLEAFLNPGSDFQDRIRSVFKAELPEGLKVTHIQD